MESFLHYDSTMCCAPEDRAGYREEPEPVLTPAETHARMLVRAAGHAVSALRDVPGAELFLGTKIPEPVALAVVRYVGPKAELRGHIYQPTGGDATRLGDAPLWLYSFRYMDRGVEVRGQGNRPATAAELAAVKP